MRYQSTPTRTPTRLKAAAPSRRGFSLIEIMVAGCILSVSVISLYSAYSFGFSIIRLSQEAVRADQILTQKLETLRVYSWAQTAPGSGVIPTTFSEQFTTGPAARGVVYNGTIAIADVPVSESYSNTLRQVTVTLNWTSGGTSHSRAMTTFIAQNGINQL
jgi:Tfp pilus assembly protein PilV